VVDRIFRVAMLLSLGVVGGSGRALDFGWEFGRVEVGFDFGLTA
jgi:hypothetical protein